MLILFVAAFFALPLGPLQASPHRLPEQVGDDFDDQTLDPAKWTSYISRDAIGWIAETDGQLQIRVSPENTSSNYRFDITSTWVLHGDFDIQVEYRLLDWHPNSGIRVGLKAGGIKRAGYLDSVERLDDQAWGEVYITHFNEGAGGRLTTADTAGTLRLVRADGDIAGYYREGDAWRLIHQGQASPQDGPVLLGVWGHEPTPGALVAFDDFWVNSGTVVEVDTPPQPPERTRFFTPSFAPAQIAMDFDPAAGDQGLRRLDGQAEQSTIWLQLNAINMPRIQGWRLSLRYDPRQLRFVPDSFEASAFLPDLAVLVTEQEGYLEIGGATLAAQAANPDYGTLGRLAFEVLDGLSDSATILATEMLLRTPDGATHTEKLLSAVSVNGPPSITHVPERSWGQIKNSAPRRSDD